MEARTWELLNSNEPGRRWLGVARTVQLAENAGLAVVALAFGRDDDVPLSLTPSLYVDACAEAVNVDEGVLVTDRLFAHVTWMGLTAGVDFGHRILIERAP